MATPTHDDDSERYPDPDRWTRDDSTMDVEDRWADPDTNDGIEFADERDNT